MYEMVFMLKGINKELPKMKDLMPYANDPSFNNNLYHTVCCRTFKHNKFGQKSSA